MEIVEQKSPLTWDLTSGGSMGLWIRRTVIQTVRNFKSYVSHEVIVYIYEVQIFYWISVFNVHVY